VDLNENPLTTPNLVKIGQNLLTVQPDTCAQETHYCVRMETLSGFTMLTATQMNNKNKKETDFSSFHDNHRYATAPRGYVIHSLEIIGQNHYN
jgi:hypothetical protein